MKNKIIATALAAVMSLGLMAGCAQKKDNVDIRVGSLKGPRPLNYAPEDVGLGPYPRADDPLRVEGCP